MTDKPSSSSGGTPIGLEEEIAFLRLRYSQVPAGTDADWRNVSDEARVDVPRLCNALEQACHETRFGIRDWCAERGGDDKKLLHNFNARILAILTGKGKSDG